MHVHAEVSGYYEWVPCPPGTVITEADHKANRVRPMANGDWHMRVHVRRETCTDVGIFEIEICDRMASLVKVGKPKSREAVVAEILTETFRQHAPTRSIRYITVVDDGPNGDLYATYLTRLGVEGDDAAEAMTAYLDDPNVETYLNATFKTKGLKKEPK